MTKLRMLLAVTLALGCANADTTLLEPEVSFDPAELAPPAEDKPEERDQGPEVVVPPYDGPDEMTPDQIQMIEDLELPPIPDETPIDGHDYPDDPEWLPQNEMIFGGAINKTDTIVGHGWSVEGNIQELSDGLDHWVPNDFSYSSRDDFSEENLGRCGRFDGTVDNSWQACLVPRLRKNNGNKRWTWKIDWASFGLNPAQWQTHMDNFNGGVVDAMNRVEAQSDIDFWRGDEALSQNINIVYNGDAAFGFAKVGAGYPRGAITMSYSADHSLIDMCETPAAAGNVPGWQDLHVYHFADVYYTYNSATIEIQWNNLWGWIVSTCAAPTWTVARSMIKTIIMHELGHVFGFAHQQLPTGSEGSIMLRNKTCTWANTHPGWNGEMVEAVNRAHTHVLGEADTLNVWDTDLSCHSPLGGHDEASQLASTLD